MYECKTTNAIPSSSKVERKTFAIQLKYYLHTPAFLLDECERCMTIVPFQKGNIWNWCLMYMYYYNFETNPSAIINSNEESVPPSELTCIIFFFVSSHPWHSKSNTLRRTICLTDWVPLQNEKKNERNIITTLNRISIRIF